MFLRALASRADRALVQEAARGKDTLTILDFHDDANPFAVTSRNLKFAGLVQPCILSASQHPAHRCCGPGTSTRRRDALLCQRGGQCVKAHRSILSGADSLYLGL